jgi:hypothetical protein
VVAGEPASAPFRAPQGRLIRTLNELFVSETPCGRAQAPPGRRPVAPRGRKTEDHLSRRQPRPGAREPRRARAARRAQVRRQDMDAAVSRTHPRQGKRAAHVPGYPRRPALDRSPRLSLASPGDGKTPANGQSACPGYPLWSLGLGEPSHLYRVQLKHDRVLDAIPPSRERIPRFDLRLCHAEAG